MLITIFYFFCFPNSFLGGKEIFISTRFIVSILAQGGYTVSFTRGMKKLATPAGRVWWSV